MARPHSHVFPLLLFLRLLLLLPAATAASYSSLCPSPAAAPDSHSRGTPLTLPSIYTGHFSGGGDLLFAPDDRSDDVRAFYFYPRESSSSATTNPAVAHLSATLTLEGTRRIRRRYGVIIDSPHSVSFDLDGYYSTASPAAELCMVGSGSYAREDGFGVVLLSDVVLRLSVPRPSNLSRPFITGRLGGADFEYITLVAYAEDDYAYGETASCPPQPGARQVLRAGSSCGRLRKLLGRSSYILEYRRNVPASSFPLRLRHGSMYVNQIRCAANGAVRAYMVFYTNHPDAFRSNHTARWRSSFSVGDEALVADGFWDSSRSRLCLKACRVASSNQSRADLAVHECGIGVSFWFPAVWSIRDRSVVTGMIWNASSNSDGNASGSGVISVSRTWSYRDDLSNIKYNYTRTEEAKKHYNAMPALSKERKGRFPGNYSIQDFAFGFSLKKQGLTGYASPVTIGSAVVEGDRQVAAAAFGAEEVNKQRLLNVSYSLRYYAAYANSSANSPQRRRISAAAEGVYDTKTGSLCMVACQTINASLDCEVLVTVQFAPMDAVATERAVGTISSLRDQSDPLFFEALDLVGAGMYVEQWAESSSRMDMESAMLLISMVLSCIFTAAQLLHVKKHPEALPATSITMLVVLALGYVIPLVLNLQDVYNKDSRKQYFVRLTSGGSLELNEFMLRLSAMVAFVLQLRLLHLAMSSRRSTDQAASKPHEDPSASDAERSTLWICLALYALGAAVVWIVHMSDALPVPRMSGAPPGPALVDDLAAYAGLILDGFLLPQVIWNAFSGSKVRALSPWFYAGGTVIRAAPHAYDVFRKQNYAPSWKPSYVYASPRDDLFGVGWDVAVPCGAALLAALLFLQQRLGALGARSCAI